jgi:hypothetical protein
MEGEVLIAEAVHLLDDGCPEGEIRTQARPASGLVPRDFLALEIFPDQLRDDRVVGQDPIDPFQLPSVLVGKTVVTEEVEGGKDWAHPVAPILLEGGSLVSSQ